MEQPNIIKDIVISFPLLKKLTSQDANTPAIICALPKVADARPASFEKGCKANAVAFGLIKPRKNRNKNTKQSMVIALAVHKGIPMIVFIRLPGFSTNFFPKYNAARNIKMYLTTKPLNFKISLKKKAKYH